MHTCTIDFADPHDRTAPRLRQHFAAPRQLLIATQLSEVRPVLAAVQAAAAQGAWCIGTVAYEAASAFDPALRTHPAAGPLAWFAVYGAPQPEWKTCTLKKTRTVSAATLGVRRLMQAYAQSHQVC